MKKLNLVGKRFGKLLVLSKAKYRKVDKESSWLCQCDCGKTKIIRASGFRAGTHSCGCLVNEMRKSRLIRTKNSLLVGEKIEELTPQQRYYRRNMKAISDKRKDLQYWKKYYKEHREHILAERKKRLDAHPEIRKELAKKQRIRYQDDIYGQRTRANERTKQMRLKCLNYYSNNDIKCACCLEKHIEFMTIDHMNNDGAEHRRKITGSTRGSGARLYQWLIKNNFPPGFQVLCINCNMARYIYGKCPHEKERIKNESIINR